MSSLAYIPNKKRAKSLLSVTSTEQNRIGLSATSNERFQSLNLAGTRVCHPDLVTWLLRWSDMLPPWTTITASSGHSLDGLPKIFLDKVGVTGFGTSIRIVDVTG